MFALRSLRPFGDLENPFEIHPPSFLYSYQSYLEILLPPFPFGFSRLFWRHLNPLDTPLRLPRFLNQCFFSIRQRDLSRKFSQPILELLKKQRFSFSR